MKLFPSSKTELREILGGWLDETGERTTPQALVVPRDTYELSGETAAGAYRQLAPPDVAVIVTNHSEKTRGLSLWSSGAWKTPLGSAKIAAEFAARLAEKWDSATRTIEKGTPRELGIEAQVPFLQYLNAQIEIVPVIVGKMSLDEATGAGESLSEVSRAYERSGKTVLWIASTNLSEGAADAKVAKKNDYLCIRGMEAVDPAFLYETVAAQSTPMPGLFAAAVVLAACRHRGLSSASLAGYRQSGEARVTGYAALCI